MVRSRLYIVAIVSLCSLVSACDKAKMRAVPRQAPAATGVAAAPTAAPSDYGPEDTQAPVPAKTPEVATAPPVPADPVARLDDSGENRRVSVGAPAPRRELRTEDGEYNRPRPRVPQQRRAPRERIVIADDCDPVPVIRERPRPIPRRPATPAPQPRPVREERVEQRQQFELDPSDELHCRWEPTAKPMTYMKYDPVTRTAWVQHGWPQKWDKYSQVRLVTGLPPYGEEGLSLVAKSGLEIAHLKATGNGTIWYERNTAYPYESYFGRVPGAPQSEAKRGVCWTKSEPAKTNDNSSGGN